MARALEGFTVSCRSGMPRTRPSPGNRYRVWPAAWASDCASLQVFSAAPPDRSRQPPGSACRNCVPIDNAHHAATRDVPERLHPGREPTRSRAPPAIAADRVLGGVLQRATSRSSTSGRRRHLGPRPQGSSGGGHRAGLIHHHGVTRRVDSNTCGPLTKIPSWAALPVPTRRAVGVASPMRRGRR